MAMVTVEHETCFVQLDVGKWLHRGHFVGSRQRCDWISAVSVVPQRRKRRTGNQKQFPKFRKKMRIITSRESISLSAPHLIK